MQVFYTFVMMRLRVVRESEKNSEKHKGTFRTKYVGDMQHLCGAMAAISV